jgi:hypothetical protein
LRAMSFILSPGLIIFSPPCSHSTGRESDDAMARALAVLLLRAKLLFIADIIAGPFHPGRA